MAPWSIYFLVFHCWSVLFSLGSCLSCFGAGQDHVGWVHLHLGFRGIEDAINYYITKSHFDQKEKKRKEISEYSFYDCSFFVFIYCLFNWSENCPI